MNDFFFSKLSILCCVRHGKTTFFHFQVVLRLNPFEIMLNLVAGDTSGLIINYVIWVDDGHVAINVIKFILIILST